MLQEPIYNAFDSLSPIRNPFLDEQDSIGDDLTSIFPTGYFSGHHTKSDSLITEVWQGKKIISVSDHNVLSTSLQESKLPAPKTTFEQYADMGIVILLILFFLISTERIAEGFVRAFKVAFNLSRQKGIDEDLTLRSSRDIAALFLLPAALFMAACNTEHFFILIISTSVYFAAKYGVMAILDYVNQTNIFKFIGRMGINYIILASAAILLAGINHWFYALCIIPVILYLVMEAVVIFKNKFSVFFYILYICTLELLPVVLLFRIFAQ